MKNNSMMNVLHSSISSSFKEKHNISHQFFINKKHLKKKNLEDLSFLSRLSRILNKSIHRMTTIVSTFVSEINYRFDILIIDVRHLDNKKIVYHSTLFETIRKIPIDLIEMLPQTFHHI